ncbi:hypothetical protein K440DRAFT_288066 [Wilcoxina mikolae CBS 423.85]|nr:hypothetical protein K440DRAFT_288066 [Wilcoxina mikolae CBS 423.85]
MISTTLGLLSRLFLKIMPDGTGRPTVQKFREITLPQGQLRRHNQSGRFPACRQTVALCLLHAASSVQDPEPSSNLCNKAPTACPSILNDNDPTAVRDSGRTRGSDSAPGPSSTALKSETKIPMNTTPPEIVEDVQPVPLPTTPTSVSEWQRELEIALGVKYNRRWRIIICLTHAYAIDPEGLETHLKEKNALGPDSLELAQEL